MNDFNRYPSGDAEGMHEEATRLAYAAIELQAAVLELRRSPDTPTSASEQQERFRELGRPLVGSVVAGEYDGQVYYYRGQRNEHLSRVLPFGGGRGQAFERSSAVRYAGILRDIDIVRRRTKPPILGLSMDPVAVDPDLAASHRQLGKNRLRHPLGIYKFDTDKTIWLPIRAVRSLAASRTGFDADMRTEAGFMDYIRRRLPENE